MRVIVVGGGAVGLCIAEALASRDADVVLLERDRCGDGASAGNAGWITPSLSIPVPGPGVIGEALRWLIDPSGPLWIRPTLSPAMLGWIARFVSKCARPSYRRGLVALQAAAGLAGAAFDRLAERGTKIEMHDDPLLYPAFEEPELDHLGAVFDQLRAAGNRQALERLAPGEVRELEPALGEHVVGGFLADGERRVRPERFVSGVRDALAGGRADLRERTAVTELTPARGAWVAHSAEESFRADAVVLAAGVATVKLLAPLGIRLPVVAAKGYSRTFVRDPTAPRRPVYLEKPKVAVSVFDGGVRVSGTLELGARELSLSRRRLTAITAAACDAMPGWRMPGNPHDWAGMRSLTPDGLPFIGGIHGLSRVYVATGHATLGITLAPLGAELLSGLILDGRRDPLLAAFDPARARTHRRSLAGARSGE
jgi:D-amino-acid dehydrogenase